MKKSGYTKDIMGYGSNPPKKKMGPKKNASGLQMKGGKVASGSRVTKGAGAFGKAKGIGAPRKRSY
jgi:hypothetical protein